MKVIIVAGARPNFMKVAPLIQAIEKRNKYINDDSSEIQYTFVHTGQHYDIKMSEVFFDDLGLPRPHFNLEVGSASHAVQTANIMIEFEKVCQDVKPDWILVVGDVNSTMACTLVAAKLGIRTAHVEAGLRSFDRTMPEEINRIVTDALADCLLTPSEDADENLLREGVASDKITRVGNIMIDTLLNNLDKAKQRRAYEQFGMDGKYVLVTIHRPANTDDGIFLPRLMEILTNLSRTLPVIFPVHPRTRNRLKSLGYGDMSNGKGNLKLIEPMGYLDFISILENALFIITDSGGVQEESTFLQIPCLTLRSTTERPITVTEGTNTLTSLHVLEKDIGLILDGKYKKGHIPHFWDGMTGERVIERLLQV